MSVHRIRIKVLLPAPFGPRSPNKPVPISRSMPSRATVPPLYTWRSPRTETPCVTAGAAVEVRCANGSVAVEPRFDVQHVAETIVYIANLPLDTNVQFMTIMATNMPYIGRG